jgi:nucleotide-binding universal stress UspA family protein
MHIQTILHPTDYSALSQDAFHYAIGLARALKASIKVLHVTETLGPENLTYGEAVSQPQPQAYQQRLWEEFLRQTPTEPGIAMERLLREGDPAEEIIRAANDLGCDLVVMGTHWRRGLRRWLEGSVAEAVIRGVSCPVLVVKPSEPAQTTPAGSSAASTLAPSR